MRIIVEEDNTGFAPADSRFSAVDDDTYSGPGSVIGWGATPEEAEADLLDQLHDREEARREAQHDHWSCYPGSHKEG